jgi:hypothetical protein
MGIHFLVNDRLLGVWISIAVESRERKQERPYRPVSDRDPYPAAAR